MGVGDNFVKLMSAVESLDALLDDGPDEGNAGSAEFLKNVQIEAREIARVADALTVADVDAEFTEADEGEGGNDGEDT